MCFWSSLFNGKAERIKLPFSKIIVSLFVLFYFQPLPFQGVINTKAKHIAEGIFYSAVCEVTGSSAQSSFELSLLIL